MEKFHCANLVMHRLRAWKHYSSPRQNSSTRLYRYILSVSIFLQHDWYDIDTQAQDNKTSSHKRALLPNCSTSEMIEVKNQNSQLTLNRVLSKDVFIIFCFVKAHRMECLGFHSKHVLFRHFLTYAILDKQAT